MINCYVTEDRGKAVMWIKYQCFVSSTFEDLKEERMECMKAILKADHIPAGMEYFQGGKNMKEHIQKWIEESDIFILILGGRYGSIDQDEEIGYTEWEYNHAVKCGKYILPIILEDAYLHEKERKFKENNQSISAFEKKKKGAYKKFKKKVVSNENKILCEYANSIDDIKNIVINNLNAFSREEKDRDRAMGWIKYEPKTLFNSVEGDLSRVSPENKRHLLSKVVCDKISYGREVADDAIIISNKIADIFGQYENALKKYLNQLSRSIDIILRDQYIEITNSTNMTYITAPTATPTGFVWNPWLYPGIEVESYKILSASYNDKGLKEDYIIKGNPEYTQNPFYVNNVIKLNIPFDETKVEHHVKYKTNYFVEYDRFFHEYVFSEFCKQFSLVATLEDRRTKKINREYMLKWSVFTLHSEQDYTSKNILFHEKNRVTFNSVDLMVPGNGYILTLGSAPKDSIQKKV